MMDELLALLRDNPAYIEELLNGKTYVGEIIGEPFLITFLRDPFYDLHIRSLTRNPRLGITHEAAEVILKTGEILPVTVIMSAHVNPTRQAWESGFWTVWDHVHGIKDTDLTAEQVPLVCWFVQRQRELPRRVSNMGASPEEALWRQEVKIKYEVLQNAEMLNMTAAEFDHIAAQRNGYVNELKKLFGDNTPDDLKPYLQDPPKPPNLRL
jgi:hypothetical protein